MHRLKIPLIALVVITMLVGPLAGHETQTNPVAPYQVSSPTSEPTLAQARAPQAARLWEFDHGEHAPGSELATVMAINGQLLLIAPERLMLLEATSRAQQWDTQLPFPIERVLWTDENDSGELFLFVGNDHYAAMLSLDSGDIVWTTEIPNATTGFWFRGGFVVSVSEIDGKTALDIRDPYAGTVLWSDHEIDAFSMNTSHAVIVQDTRIRGVALASGETMWRMDYASFADMHMTDDHLILFGEDEISGFDLHSGAEVWLNLAQPGYTWHTDTSNDWILVLDGGSVRAIESKAGAEFWSRTASSVISTLPSTVILRHDHTLIGIDVSTGQEKWTVTTGVTSIFEVSEIGNTHWIKSADGHILVLGGEDDSILTLAEPETRHRSYETTHVFQTDNKIVALDSERGESLWSHTTPSPVASLSISHNLVIYVSALGEVTSLDIDTGEVAASFSTSEEGSGRLGIRGDVVLRSNDAEVVIYHAGTGEVLGSMPENDVSDIQLVTSGDARFLQGNESVASLDSKTSEIRYTTPLNSGLVVFLPDGSLVGVAHRSTPSGTTSVLQATNTSGAVAWEIEVDQEIIEIDSPFDDTYVMVSMADKVLAVDSVTGRRILEAGIPYGDSPDTWTVPAPTGVLHHSQNETVFYGLPAAVELGSTAVLRGAPNHQSADRGTFPAGTIVTPTGNQRERDDGVWLEVQIDGITGWLHEDALGDAPVATPESTPVNSSADSNLQRN